MDKIQFLDLSDLLPGEEEQLACWLYGVDISEAVELPWNSPPPSWVQHQVPYVVLESEPIMGGVVEEQHLAEMEVDQQQVDYATGTPMMAPHTVQYTQMMPTPSVYVSNVTANVNVHGFMPGQPMAYSTGVPYMAPAAAPEPSSTSQSRKPRQAKTPTKRSPEVRQGMDSPQTPTFSQPFTQSYYSPGAIYPPPIWYPIPLQQQMARPFVYPTAPNTYPATPPVYTAHQIPLTPAAEVHVELPQEETVVYTDENIEPETIYLEPQSNQEEEDEEVVDTYVVENSSLQQTVEEVPLPVVADYQPVEFVDRQAEEIKIEKPPVTKAPPANAFKSAPNPTQKPPFPMNQKQKRVSLDNGPEIVEPPVESGPPKKSFASLFGSGEKAAQLNKLEVSSPKPLAMIHPTIYNNVNNVPVAQQNFVDKQNSSAAVKEHMTNSFNNGVFQDYDINLQRLGEFVTDYKLDHRPLMLQPRGLTNRSNYCYINAILQALIACPPFYNLMKAIPASQESKHCKSRTPIIDSMVKFVNEFLPMSTSTRPVGRKEKAQANKDGNAEVVCGPAFEPTYVYKMLSAMHAAFPIEGRQEDAEEFLSCLLNGLNDEMLEAVKLIEPQTNGLTNGDATTNGDVTTNGDGDHDKEGHEWTEVINKSNKSVITRRTEFGNTPLSAIFRGQMRSRVIRQGVENSTADNVQPFFTLQLDVEKADSVVKALELLVGKDEVIGGTCPKTNKEISVFTQTTLEELPNILLLHLKCFDYKLHTCAKIMKTLEFPIDLKIDNKLLSMKSKASTKDRSNNKYKLLAVVYHDGKEATKGHYMTDVYHTGYMGWVRYDDATVRPVTQQQVLNPKSPRVPYLLYYRRADTIGPSTTSSTPAPAHTSQDKNR